MGCDSTEAVWMDPGDSPARTRGGGAVMQSAGEQGRIRPKVSPKQHGGGLRRGMAREGARIKHLKTKGVQVKLPGVPTFRGKQILKA